MIDFPTFFACIVSTIVAGVGVAFFDYFLLSKLDDDDDDDDDD